MLGEKGRDLSEGAKPKECQRPHANPQAKGRGLGQTVFQSSQMEPVVQTARARVGCVSQPACDAL